MKYLQLLFIFILTSIVIFILLSITVYSCESTNNYKWEVQFGIGKIIFQLIIKLIIFIVGIIVFLLVRKFVKFNNYRLFKKIYFIVFSLSIFYAQIYKISQSVLHLKKEYSICSKSTTEGLTTKSNSLNLSEYNYLYSKFHLLPDLPSTSDSININYYTDNFLGDYMLDIQFRCKGSAHIDTADHHWMILNVDKKNNIQYANYYANGND